MTDERRELEEDNIEDLELSDEDDAAKVRGGNTVSKAKTADKAYTQMDAYIKQ